MCPESARASKSLRVMVDAVVGALGPGPYEFYDLGRISPDTNAVTSTSLNVQVSFNNVLIAGVSERTSPERRKLARARRTGLDSGSAGNSSPADVDDLAAMKHLKSESYQYSLLLLI
jgi:hypothetical protein